MHLLDIPKQHVAAIASILQFRAGENTTIRAKRISHDAKALPSLLRPGRLERLLLPPLGHLCKMHNGLDYSVVKVVLEHIQLEVGERLNNLVWRGELLTSEQLSRVTRLRSLHALWVPREEYELTFLASTRDCKWQYQQDRCEACIVSQITGDLEILLDLRCAIRSRATSKLLAKRGEPRLQIWVHAWIDELVQHLKNKTGQRVDVDALIAENEIEALALMRRRTKIHALRNKTFKDVTREEGDKNAQPADFDDKDEDEDEDDAHDAELDVINAYDALKSKSVISAFPLQSPSRSRSQRGSADPSKTGESPYQHPHPARPQESFYSIDGLPVNRPRLPGSNANVLEDVAECPLGPAQEEKPYIPPRQLWKKQQQPASQVQPRSGSSRATKAALVSRDSWETAPVESSSTVFQPARRSSRSCIPAPNERCPADTYVNLLGPAPFNSNSSVLTATSREPCRPLLTPDILNLNFSPNGVEGASDHSTIRPAGSYESVYNTDADADAEDGNGNGNGKGDRAASHEYASTSCLGLGLGLSLSSSSSATHSGESRSVQTPDPSTLTRLPSPSPPPAAGQEAKSGHPAESSSTISSWGAMYASGLVYREDLGWFYVQGK